MKETRTLCDICEKDITDNPVEVAIYYNGKKGICYDLCRKHEREFGSQLEMHVIGFLKNQRHIATGRNFGEKK
jgi:hypothetical protein